MTEPQPDTSPQTGQAPRWMKITLVVSLALNLLIVGAVAGAVVTKGGKSEARRDGPGANMITDALPKDERRMLRRDVRQALRDSPELRGGLRAEIAALADLMRASEFNADALEAQLIEIQSRIMGPLSVARDKLSDRLANLDEAGRSEYADRLDMLLEKKRP